MIFPLGIEKSNEWNEISIEIIVDILSNDITLLISSSGFDNIVQCDACFMEHWYYL